MAKKRAVSDEGIPTDPNDVLSDEVKAKLAADWDSDDDDRAEVIERGEIISWEKGLIIAGKVIGEPRKAGKGYIMDLALPDSEIVVVGCPTILRDYMKHANKGDKVRIECLGKIPSTNGPAWDFNVKVKRG